MDTMIFIILLQEPAVRTLYSVRLTYDSYVKGRGHHIYTVKSKLDSEQSNRLIEIDIEYCEDKVRTVARDTVVCTAAGRQISRSCEYTRIVIQRVNRDRYSMFFSPLGMRQRVKPCSVMNVVAIYERREVADSILNAMHGFQTEHSLVRNHSLQSPYRARTVHVYVPAV